MSLSNPNSRWANYEKKLEANRSQKQSEYEDSLVPKQTNASLSANLPQQSNGAVDYLAGKLANYPRVMKSLDILANNPVTKTISSFGAGLNPLTLNKSVSNFVYGNDLANKLEESKRENPNVARAGELVTTLVPFVKASQLASKIPQLAKLGQLGTLGKVGQMAAQEGIAGAGVGAVEGLYRGEGLEGAKDRAINYGLGSALIGGGLTGAGILGKNVYNNTIGFKKAVQRTGQAIDNYQFPPLQLPKLSPEVPLKYRQPLPTNEPLMLSPAKTFTPPKVPEQYRIELAGMPAPRQLPINAGNNLNRPNVQSGVNLPPIKNNVLNEPVQLTQQTIKNKYAPEIQKQLDDIDNQIKSYRDQQNNLVQSGNKYRDQADKAIKGTAMRLSAKKRELIQGDSLIPVDGGLTAKELNDKIKRLKTNYSGKDVITPDGEGKLVGQSSFGKVGIDIGGQVKYYTKEQIQPKFNIDDVIEQQKNNATSSMVNKNAQGDIKSPPLKNNELNESLNRNVSKPLPLPEFKNRQFIENSYLNSEVPTPKMKSEMKRNIPQYEPLTNKETLNSANIKINKNGYEKSKNDFLSAQKLIDAEDTATGQALIQKAIASGKYTEANDIAINLAEKLTNAGQTVQAASIFKRMSPEGMLQYGNKVINKANKELQAKAGNKVIEKIKFTSEEVKFITNNMEEITKTNNGELQLLDINLQAFADGKLAEVMKLIAGKIPANLGEKIKAFQRINLLLNPKTMIRNLAGNVISSGIANVKDVLATGIDKGVSKLTGKRTMLLPSLKTQAQGGKKGFDRVLSDYERGINTSPVGTQYEIDGRTISPFKNKILRNLDEATKTGLRLADDPFYQSAYDDILRREMQLKGVNSPSPEMKIKADQTAKERTFQDTNRITELFTLIQRGLNRIGTKNFGLGNVVIPFVKTPANILARALEYSPVELAKVTKQLYNAAVKNGNFDQYKFVDSLAKSISGTALIGSGYELAQKGIISGASSKDKDARNFATTVGILPYSFKVGGKTYTYDWAQPSSIPIAMGADIYYNLKKSKNPDNVLIESAKSGLNALFSQSLVQGLNKMFGGSSFGGGDIAENLTNTLLSATSQFIPLGSLQRQIGEIADPYKRETADESIIKSKVVNPFKNTVLGLRQILPVKINTIGEPVKAGGFVDTMINPARSSDYNGNPVYDELLRLNSQANENKQFPTTATNKISYKTSKKGETQNLTLTPEQLASYKTKLGQSNLQAIKKIISTSGYINANDKQRADLISKSLSESKQKTENEFLKLTNINEYKSNSRSRNRR